MMGMPSAEKISELAIAWVVGAAAVVADNEGDSVGAAGMRTSTLELAAAETPKVKPWLAAGSANTPLPAMEPKPVAPRSAGELRV